MTIYYSMNMMIGTSIAGVLARVFIKNSLLLKSNHFNIFIMSNMFLSAVCAHLYY
jgi:hypothetical protein